MYYLCKFAIIVYKRGVGFMNSQVCLLILKNTAKLEKLISQNASYNKILKQSRKLDKYILIEMQHINKVMS